MHGVKVLLQRILTPSCPVDLDMIDADFRSEENFTIRNCDIQAFTEKSQYLTPKRFIINSYAWEMSVSGHLTFKCISSTFLIVRFLRAKMVIPSFETLTSYGLIRF